MLFSNNLCFIKQRQKSTWRRLRAGEILEDEDAKRTFVILSLKTLLHIYFPLWQQHRSRRSSHCDLILMVSKNGTKGKDLMRCNKQRAQGAATSTASVAKCHFPVTVALLWFCLYCGSFWIMLTNTGADVNSPNETSLSDYFSILRRTQSVACVPIYQHRLLPWQHILCFASFPCRACSVYTLVGETSQGSSEQECSPFSSSPAI